MSGIDVLRNNLLHRNHDFTKGLLRALRSGSIVLNGSMCKLLYACVERG